MEANLLRSITTQIHRRFPEFAGVQPKVRQQDSPQPKSAAAPTTYLLTFKSTAQADSQKGLKILPRLMRVVVDGRGKILKITTSR